MINTQDQEELFRLIAEYLEEDLECVAIGGTAMMFHGYKATTKDIDLVFKNRRDRDVFIGAIVRLGYSQSSLRLVYDEKRLKSRNKPVIYSRGDERFDLFAKDVFGFEVEFGMSETATRNLPASVRSKRAVSEHAQNTPLALARGGFDNFVQRHDYIGKKELTVFTAPKEYLIVLKSVTNREKDYEDIETIVMAEKDIDWKGIAELAIKKRKQVPWILIDMEEKMRRLKKITFIKKEVFDEIYRAEEQAAGKH